jgi:heme/copper-type cytochrome/quinol oxidase subunit 3
MNRNRPLNLAEKKERDRKRKEREARIAAKNKRLGLFIFQGSWILVFICLIVAYWQLGFSPGWRPTPEQAPNPLWPTIGTLALLLSVWTGHRAWRIATATPADEARSAPWMRSWSITLALGALFLLLMLSQLFVIPSGEEQLFGYIYRLMIGYHAVHAVVIGGLMLAAAYYGRQGRYHTDNIWPIEASVKLWDFVVVAWVLFYVVLYAPFLL